MPADDLMKRNHNTGNNPQQSRADSTCCPKRVGIVFANEEQRRGMRVGLPFAYAAVPSASRAIFVASTVCNPQGSTQSQRIFDQSR
jgi:hypothetical protein